LRRRARYRHRFASDSVPFIRRFVINVRGVVLAFLVIAVSSGLVGSFAWSKGETVGAKILITACSGIPVVLAMLWLWLRWVQEFGPDRARWWHVSGLTGPPRFRDSN
jgi:hypothetical protein